MDSRKITRLEESSDVGRHQHPTAPEEDGGGDKGPPGKSG